MTSKLIVVAAICSLGILSTTGCTHRASAGSRTISATSDSSESHPATADVSGPVAVTCVSATGDNGAVIPPACVIDAPGTNGIVKLGDKVAVVGAGKVALTCQGSGSLACTAKIEE